MNKLIIFAVCFLAMAALASAQYGQQYGHHYPQYEERKWLQIPALKLKIDSDKLMFRLPNLGNLFGGLIHREPEYPEHDEY